MQEPQGILLAAEPAPSVSLAHAPQFAEFFDRLSEGVPFVFGQPHVITPSEHVVIALMEYTKLPKEVLERCWLMSGARGQDGGLDKAGFVACLCLTLMVEQGHSLPDAVPADILQVAQLVSTNRVGFAFQAGTSQQQPTPPPDVPPAACRAPPGSVSTATEFGHGRFTASYRPTTGDPVKVLRGEHEGRYGRLTKDDHDSTPYKVRFYDGAVSGWLAEDAVEKVSEQEKSRAQAREKQAAEAEQEDDDLRPRRDAKKRAHKHAAASQQLAPASQPALGNVPEYWEGRYAGEHGFAMFLIDPSSNLWGALNTVMRVPDPNNLGVGRDASGEDYSELKLRYAWRVEHPTKWTQYAAAKVEVQSQMKRCSTPHHRRLRTALQNAYEAVPEMSCDDSINEVFLLHGTKPDILYNLLSNGLVEGFSNGLFGQVYP